MVARVFLLSLPVLVLLSAIPSGAIQREALSIQFSGTRSVASGTTTVEIDLFDVSAGEIAALSASGYVTQCYFSAGTWEDWRPDKKSFPARTRGNDLADWPGEKWLDTRSREVRRALAARLDLAKEKWCDRVDPDNIDGYRQNTGFPITRNWAIGFAEWLADEAHARDMGIVLKNVPELAGKLEPRFDASVAESCALYGWCAELVPFVEAGKPVFAIEYPELGGDEEAACGTAEALGISMLFKNRSLDAWERRCPEAEEKNPREWEAASAR